MVRAKEEAWAFRLVLETDEVKGKSLNFVCFEHGWKLSRNNQVQPKAPARLAVTVSNALRTKEAFIEMYFVIK